MPDLSQPLFIPPRPLSAERLLSAIVDSSDDAIVSKNLDAIVTSWNLGAERMFGYTAQEMVGQPILRLLPLDRQTEEANILGRLRRGERVEHFETVRVCKDGRLIDVSLTISPVRDENGQIVGASKIARNITEQRLALVKLAAANEALRRADRMKGEFISTLSHELRTPLNAIVGWLEVLTRDASKEELAEGLDVIRRNVKAQTRLIDDLLDMSRIESGKLTLDIQRMDIAEVLTAALDSVRPAANGKGVRLSSAFASIDGVILGDKNRLQQVAWNLLTNAVKFSNRGGRIHVTTQRVNSHLEIAVSDTGVGIALEYAERIFDRFSQADASTTKNYGGLGLGLAIAKQIVELHGGTIHVNSAGTGAGSTFVIHLPLLPAAPEREETLLAKVDATDGYKLELATLKILAVDDDPDSVHIVRRILERAGAEVQTATSMTEALEVFQQFEPDVVVSDIGMPGHDGYELIKALRALPNGKKTVAIALTALARAEDRTRALRAGFQMHVAKPLDAEELVSSVKNLASLRGE
jgi:PAS domain S-box-containing protein